ncbi:MAG TPA: DUF6644 family protein [Gammaproteobacteria bacterium]
MTILGICEWLEATAIAVLIRESLYGFSIVVATHILGITLSVGTLLWADLRMLDISMRGYRLSEVYRGLAPWFVSGFGVMILSGAILFAAFATSAYGNLYFRIKMVAIALAGLNALIYHVAGRLPTELFDAARTPTAARIAGLTSIVLWGAVIVAGRMISYTMF